MKTKHPPSPLRLRRVTLGLSLMDVETALRAAGARVVSTSQLSMWERGQRDVPADVLPILARILKCRAGDLR